MKKSFLQYIAAVLAVIMLSTISVSAAGYTPAEKAQLKFDERGNFRILQIADIQDNMYLSNLEVKFLRYVLEKEQPDLIVLTGDNIAGYLNGTIAFPDVDETIVRKSIKNYMEVFEEAYEKTGVRVIAVFGNHDDQITAVSKEKQVEIYQEYDCYIGYDEAIENINITGVGNCVVPIFSSDYTPVVDDTLDKAYQEYIEYALMMIDSNSYVNRKPWTLDGVLSDYDCVHNDQLVWFENEMNAISAMRGKTVNSMVFQHIIVPDIYDALKEVPAGTEGAVANKYDASKYYVLPDGAKGTLGESPCSPNPNNYNNEYERLIAVGAQAFFFGHDHENDFEVPYKGATMYNTSTVGFCSYGAGNRGIREINLHENGGDVTYDTNMIYYQGEFTESDENLKDEYDANAKDKNFFEVIIAWFKTLFRYFLGILGKK